MELILDYCQHVQIDDELERVLVGSELIRNLLVLDDDNPLTKFIDACENLAKGLKDGDCEDYSEEEINDAIIRLDIAWCKMNLLFIKDMYLYYMGTPFLEEEEK